MLRLMRNAASVLVLVLVATTACSSSSAPTPSVDCHGMCLKESAAQCNGSPSEASCEQSCEAATATGCLEERAILSECAMTRGWYDCTPSNGAFLRGCDAESKPLANCFSAHAPTDGG
jgi:hypothetical protein